MGDAAAEAALCSEARFQQFLGEALRQGSSQGGEGVQENDHVAGDTAARLRSKAAFVLKVSDWFRHEKKCDFIRG